MEEKPIGKNSMALIPFGEYLYVFPYFFLNAGASTSNRMPFKDVGIDR